MEKNKKVVIFANFTKTKMYMTNKDNFDSRIFNANSCVELENFSSLDDAKDFLENMYGYDVEINY